MFNRGDGADTVSDYGGSYGSTDRLLFGDGILAADVGAYRSGNHLVVTVAGQAGDQITIQNWFYDAGGYYRLEQVEFADGSMWTGAQLAQVALTTTNTGTAGDDVLRGISFYSERLVGGDGNDTLIAVGPDDVLEGGAGNDTLETGTGTQNTTFIGGTGNDTLEGSVSAETYVFHRGDGADTLIDYGGSYGNVDRIVFGEDVAPADIGAYRSGNHLVLTVSGQVGDQITIHNWFYGVEAYYRIERIDFADGSTWTGAQLAQLALTTTNTGTSGDDVLSGTAFYSERLAGGDGNDTLTAVGVGDVLEGGAGNDVLKNGSGAQTTTFNGGAGNDTHEGNHYVDVYLYQRGDGADVLTDYSTVQNMMDRIVFGEGITSGDIGARRWGNDLILNIAGQAGDQITIKSWFYDGLGRFHIERLEFVDGSSLNAGQLTQLALTTTNTGTAGNDVLSGTAAYSERILGGDGNDTLTAMGNNDQLEGGAGDDVLRNSSGTNQNGVYIGGTGNDTITGSQYADTYRFERGDGADTITDYSASITATDKLVFGENITDQDVWLSRSGNHLHIDLLGDGGQVRVNNWYSSAQYRIEELHLSDGQKLLFNQVDALVNAMAAFAPPAPGQTTLTPEQQTALAPVIAAAWN